MSKFKIFLNEAMTGITTFTHEVATGIYLKNPNAELSTSMDIYRYMTEGRKPIITPATINNSKQVIPISIEKVPEYKLIQDNIDLPKAKLKDAKSIAENLRKAIGEPDSNKSVYWTGPTNDKSEYGSADITYISKGVVQPVSLKFGKGQLKNLSLGTLGDVLLKGIISDEEKFIKVLFTENEKEWDNLTRQWIHLFMEILPNTKTILHKYSSLSFDRYQKASFTKEELEEFESIIKDYNIPWNIKYRGKDKEGRLRSVLKSLYNDIPSFDTKWKKIKKDMFDRIFGKYFDDTEKILNKNLFNLFKKQMSVSSFDMWYVSKGGKVLLFVPNENSFNRIGQQLNFSMKSISTPSGYQIILKINIGDTNVQLMVINISIRWVHGQMWDKPEANSTMSGKFKPDQWNNLFKS